MRIIAETVNSVPPNPLKAWNKRILLGCWAAKYLPLCVHYLPDYAINHIGFSTSYSSQFLSVPNVSFNMLQKGLLPTFRARRFISKVHAANRSIFVWTVNEPEMMRWSIEQQCDGVITDDPKLFEDVCRDWKAGKTTVKYTKTIWFETLWMWTTITIFGALFYWKYGPRAEITQMRPEKTRLAARNETGSLISPVERGNIPR